MASLKYPTPFNQNDNMQYIVAPFWSDIDTRTEGSISYEIHTNKTSLSLLQHVSRFIQQKEQNQFSATWMLVAEWSSVLSSGMCEQLHIAYIHEGLKYCRTEAWRSKIGPWYSC